MYKVLLAVDENKDRAEAQATSITDLPGTDEIEVVVFHDFVENPSGASVTQVGSVRRAVDILEEAGISHSLTEASGEPSETILKVAEEEDADLISLAGRDKTPTGKVLFGSVTQAVILNADRPVMVVTGNR